MFGVFQYKLPWEKIVNDKAIMTPLDLFCLKENKKQPYDELSENKLASILYDVTKKNHTYCGLKPIALAMLTGKINLFKTFLEKDREVINKTIPGLGTLLTLLLNPTYNINLSYRKLSQFLKLLVNANSNPFKIVKISNDKFRGNIYEFCFMLSETEKYFNLI